MSIDDDKQLASEIEDALRALGIAKRRQGADSLVEPLVRELRGDEMEQSADDTASGQQEADIAP